MNAIKDNTVKADNQVKGNQNIFFLGDENAKKKIAILGNSITLHGECPEIGWYGHYGMAASCKENDYVHLLFSYLERDNGDSRIMVNQVADWERTFDTFDLSAYDCIRDFTPDIIIFRCGENVRREMTAEFFQKHLNKLINHISGANAEVIFTTCFWHNKTVDDAIRAEAAERNAVLIEMGDLGDDPTMKALGLFEHGGVASHPCDKGMKAIADRIYVKLK